MGFVNLLHCQCSFFHQHKHCRFTAIFRSTVVSHWSCEGSTETFLQIARAVVECRHWQSVMLMYYEKLTLPNFSKIRADRNIIQTHRPKRRSKRTHETVMYYSQGLNLKAKALALKPNAKVLGLDLWGQGQDHRSRGQVQKGKKSKGAWNFVKFTSKTGRHLSMGSHSVICHPTKVTAPPSSQPGRLVLDLSTP